MDAMTDETDTTSEVARVLRAHLYYVPQGEWPDGVLPDDVEWECAGCGHDIGADDVMEERHVAHMAQALAEAGLLREAKRATGGPVTGKSQIVGLPEGGCEYLVPLEHAQIATQAPAEQPHAPSGGNGTGGGLGERLRALASGQTRSLRKELREIADEVDEVEAAYRVADAEIARLSEFHDHYRAQVERVRAQLVRMTKSSDEGTRRHGNGLLRILDGAGATNEKGEGS